VSTLDHTLKPEATTARRLEVITGTGRRRWFSADDKARMIEETLVPGAVVSEVARRHGLAPQQLFTWRRQARQPAGADAATEVPQFVPAVVESALAEGAARRRQRQRARPVDRASGIIEVEIEGVSVRVGRGADAKTVAVVIRALKAGT
jgi:transposase